MASRNLSIDIAKGIGIALVVVGHNQIVTHMGGGLLFALIYSFHVPLFFFLSGLFVRPNESWRAVIRGRADSLLKPYFVLLLAFGAVLAAQQALRGSGERCGSARLPARRSVRRG